MWIVILLYSSTVYVGTVETPSPPTFKFRSWLGWRLKDTKQILESNRKPRPKDSFMYKNAIQAIENATSKCYKRRKKQYIIGCGFGDENKR